MAQQIRTALIVDDSRLSRVALSKLLTNRGIEVAMAGCGEDGLEHLRGHQPDIVFMDYMMPDMDGFEASRRALSDPSCHKAPIVMYTSQDTDEDRLKAAEIGIAGFLGKPTTLGALDEVLEAIASGRMRAAAAPVPAQESQVSEPVVVAAPVAPVAPPTPVAAPVAEPAAPAVTLDAARATAREVTEQLALRYFEQLREELNETLAQALRGVEEIETAAERRTVAAVEAAISQLPPPQEPVDLRALETQLRQVAENSAQQVAGGIARDAGAAAARALAPQMVAEARQAAIEAVELADLHGRLQTMVEQEVVPALRQELLAAMRQDTQTAVEAGLSARVDQLESRLLEAAEHAAAAELRASSGALLAKSVAAGVIAGVAAAVVTVMLL
jgi:CheY-like chemotaxis protein